MIGILQVGASGNQKAVEGNWGHLAQVVLADGPLLCSCNDILNQRLTCEKKRHLVRLLARKQQGRQQQHMRARMARKTTMPMTMITTFTILS